MTPAREMRILDEGQRDCPRIACRLEAGDFRAPRVRRVSRRERTLLTLDLPTYRPSSADAAMSAADTFFSAVIEPLLAMQGKPRRDHVYGWLEAMFRFCAGKPFVYCSRYCPSARIYSLARNCRVGLVWQPLGRVPAELLKRNRTWRQLWLTESQWAAIGARLGLGRAA